MELIKGGYQIRNEDKSLLATQRAITKQMNERFIQVGAVYLKMAAKAPIDENWARTGVLETNLQDWIEHEDKELFNVGFNLQFGWVDIDIDYDDPDFNRIFLAALDHCGVDTRFRFGRRSVGFPTHVLVQLGEEEAANFEHLKKFEPKQFILDGKRCQVELRSYPTTKTDDKVYRAAKQTVMPGSVYSHKKLADEYDISVWYTQAGKIASASSNVAATTPRRCDFNSIIRAIAFATFAYAVRNHWVEGGRQDTANRVSGWLARVVREGRAMNNHEVISNDVWCPVDDDSIVESLLHFTCTTFSDEEPHMRVRTYYDAMEKLDRNPDAKIPGWPTIVALIGSEYAHALRTVFTPGSDVSVLTQLAERYIFDESDNTYIDRDRHIKGGKYYHESQELALRHKHQVVRIGGKAKEAFRIYEASDMRKRVDARDLHPDLDPGGIYRFSQAGNVLDDDSGEQSAITTFNTWRGWPILPTEHYNEELMDKCLGYLDRLLGYMTCDNKHQMEWIKQDLAWTFQHPGRKQQIALVCVGDQGVGKSFFGNVFVKAIMGRLWGAASPKVFEGAFSVEPFIDNMYVFIDEAKFHGDQTVDEIKKFIRSVDIGGAEKYGASRTYRIFARLAFASNRFDINIGQQGVTDRALFYTKAYHKDFMEKSEAEFRAWAEQLKPWFTEFAQFLERRDVREHYVYYFMKRPTDIKEVESIKYSSSTDVTIVAANMSWSRRVAKYMLEEARVHEDLAIEYPFTVADFNKRVADVSKDMGFRNLQGARVLAEWQDAGLLERHIEAGKAMLRLKHRWADSLDHFAAATGAHMEPQFEITDADRGKNETKLTDRPDWKGMKKAKF